MHAGHHLGVRDERARLGVAQRLEREERLACRVLAGAATGEANDVVAAEERAALEVEIGERAGAAKEIACLTELGSLTITIEPSQARSATTSRSDVRH